MRRTVYAYQFQIDEQGEADLLPETAGTSPDLLDRFRAARFTARTGADIASDDDVAMLLNQIRESRPVQPSE